MDYFICPNCKNQIYDEDALLCHFCGESLGKFSHGATGQMRGSNLNWLIAFIVIAALISLIIIFH